MSRAPATATSTLDCSRSRPGEIAFCQPGPSISSTMPTSSTTVIYNQNLSIANTSTNAGAVLHLASIEAQGTTQPRAGRRSIRSATQSVRSVSTLVLGAVTLASVLDCGTTYRPAVSAINPVGPAGQPPKYPIPRPTPTPPPPAPLPIADSSAAPS